MRGRKPMPTALKILTGNRGKRPLDKHEPRPPAGVPECPDWIDDTAKAVWNRIVPLLSEMGVLTKIDGDVVADYCVATAEWGRASRFIQENGQTYEVTSPSGCVSVHPYPQVGIALKYWNIARWCATELGMTPSSRTRIRTEPFAQVDEFEAFLRADRWPSDRA